MKSAGSLLRGFALLALLFAAPPAIADDVVPPDPAPRWFKGNLHTHSLWSDGNDFPEMIAEWYRTHGYNFLALSDHNVLSQGVRWMDVDEAHKRGDIGALERYRQRFGGDWVETRTVDGKQQVRLKPLEEFRPLVEERGKFLMVQSEEITDHYQSLPVHMNATHIRELIKPQGGKSVRETIANNLSAVEQQRRRTGQPMLAHLNHPNFQWGVTAEDIAEVIGEQFFEVYNGHPGVNQQGDETHASVERLWDIANTLRVAKLKAPPLAGVATDDSHNYFGDRGASPGRGWVMVRAKHLTPEKLVAALEARDFYASSGVSLKDVRYSPERRALEIDIDPVPGAKYKTEFIGTLKTWDQRHEPVRDKDGKELPVTRNYSRDVGQVLATVEGVNPKYTLTGRELYVRATITADKPPVNPSFKGQFQQAWTQPVGWETRVEQQRAQQTGR